ncbi:stage II sporulation protein R [Saccharococcus caldoxylosilyticus]|uniref:stage II sporulation protein R n=1 Tax=Saccharococcus caldoxylosilyticus TaxID=81408 RepID=UPI001FCB68EC|nr:stage II sporulation protein R [Parageobacillus caldoxylosilyticus]BDG37717.1 stage II sporulation protein R [Parageobacillus caldoxylosilyticus]BDG41509.1 stage II sporulation protein R [Parageobacillus caldoxylosilyticus]
MSQKKLAIVLYILLLMVGVLVNVYGYQTEAGANATVAIPDKAIRLRILANSDSAEDQELKHKVRDAVNAKITKWVADLTSFAEAKRVIQSHLPEIEQTVADVLRKEHSDQSYQVEFGQVDFPTKIYGNFIYPAGKYDAVLITLGEGKGANWWCVLFPPLCFLDFSNSDAVQMSEASSVQNEEKDKKSGQSRKTDAVTDDENKETAETDGQQDAGSKAVNKEVKQAGVAPTASPFVAEQEQPVKIKFFLKELISYLIP